MHVQCEEAARIVDKTPRALLAAELQTLSHARPAHPSVKPSELLVPAHQLATSLAAATEQLRGQYHAAMRTSSLRVFENVGELFAFMEGFNAEQYLSAKPSSADILTDMSVMRAWERELTALPSALSHGLLCFDLQGLGQHAISITRAALLAFAKLVREMMYERCMELQVRAHALSSFDQSLQSRRMFGLCVCFQHDAVVSRSTCYVDACCRAQSKLF